MNHKVRINKLIGIGFLCFLFLSVAVWMIVPAPGKVSHHYWLNWLFLYSIPMFFGVLITALKRYNSDELIKGYLSSNSGVELERAYMHNKSRQSRARTSYLPLLGSHAAVVAGVTLLMVARSATYAIGTIMTLVSIFHFHQRRTKDA